MPTRHSYSISSIGKKQIVAITGLLLIVFLIGHLAGNLFIYGGADAYNAYAKKLASLRPALNGVEFGLLIVFLLHMYFTALVVIENIQARGGRYAVYKPVGERSWATRLMPYTGVIIVIFVIQHLLDFTFIDHDGPLSVMRDGVSRGLYGVVYNSFTNLGHSLFYIIAMMCLGLHLAHGIQSFFQTYGLLQNKMSCVRQLSNAMALLIAFAYSSIPVYVFLDSLK